jgi:hypothetical protein
VHYSQIIKEPNYGHTPLILADNPYPLSSGTFRRNLDVNGTCSPSKNPVGMYHALESLRAFVDLNGDQDSIQESRTEKSYILAVDQNLGNVREFGVYTRDTNG